MGYSDPGPSRGQHAALRASWRNSSPGAGLADRWCSWEPRSRVSTSACSLPITLSAPQVSCSWMPPTKTRHMKCRRWRDLFLCCRRSASSDCLAFRSARESNRWLRQCASSRGQRVSAQLDTRRRLTRLFIFGRARRRVIWEGAGVPIEGASAVQFAVPVAGTCSPACDLTVQSSGGLVRTAIGVVPAQTDPPKD
jgi:hypothetical protein